MEIMNEELMAKARQAKSAGELLTLAKENNVELTEEQANIYFEQMNKVGELSEDELDSVAGGGCSNYHDNSVSPNGTCSDWQCDRCGAKGGCWTHYFYERSVCSNCRNCYQKNNNEYYCGIRKV